MPDIFISNILKHWKYVFKMKEMSFAWTNEESVPFYVTKTTRWDSDQILSAHQWTSLSFMLKQSKCHIYTISAAGVLGTMFGVSSEHLINQLDLQLRQCYISKRLAFN